MLKDRLIPVLFLRNGYLVRSESFQVHQNLGNPVAQVERYDAWDVDELIYIDITRSGHHDYQRSDLGGLRGVLPATFEEIIPVVAEKCFMPLTFGGGIRTLEDARRRFESGADKITVNTQALQDPSFISALAHEFGSQAVVVSIDARLIEGGAHQVFSQWGSVPTGRDPRDWAREAQERGAGEILINSIDRDGKACGYDIELIRGVVEATSVPVIACGGAGNYDHFVDVFRQARPAAVAAGNLFHFKELAYPMAKRHLKKHALNVR